MKLVFKAPLFGACDIESWLVNLKNSNIKIERSLYCSEELKEKYICFNNSFDLEHYFCMEGYKYVCYELCYTEKLANNFTELTDDKYSEIFEKCNKLIKLISSYFGTIIDISFGTFYLNNELVLNYFNTLSLSYNPTFFELLFRIDSTDDEVSYFLDNYESFLKTIENDKIIGIVLDTYKLNLSISDMKIAFLNLVTCLETLFVDSSSELSYQVSRGVAVLLSKDKEDGRQLYSKMKKLYDIRSKLVHKGIWNVDSYYNKYNKKAFDDLKRILVCSFRKYLKLNLKHDKFLEAIRENGYGDFNNY